MIRFCSLLLCLAGLLGGASTQSGGSSGSFANGDFETGDYTGWIQGGGFWYSLSDWPLDPSKYLPGGSSYDATGQVNTVVGPGPLFDPRTDNKLQIVYNGSKTAKVNDERNNYSVSVISQTVSNYAAPHIFFAWAAVLEASHGPTDSDNFTLQLKDVTTGENIYQVAYNSADASSAHLFTRSNSNWFYTAWQVQDLDVSDRQGHTFTLTLLASDCPYGGHAGYVYLDGFGAVTPPEGPKEGGTLTLSGSGDLGTFPLGNSINGAFAASGGTPPYSWTTLGSVPAGVKVNGGSISGIPSQPGNYSVGLLLTDSTGKGISGTLNFSVFGFTSNALPPGIVLSPYQGNAMVGGGTPPYTFTFSGLPAGLSGNGSGLIQGTVNAAGTSQVLVVATDSAGVSATARLPLTFSLAPAISSSSYTMPAGITGQVYSQSAGGISGGAPPYTWKLISGIPPDGLSLRSDGTIAGLPSRAGTYSFGVRATDAAGASAVTAVTLTINPVALSVTAPTPPNGTANFEFPTQNFTARGGTPPYSFALTGGALPTGMTVDANGTLSGTPQSAGTFNISVTATDAAGGTGSASATFTVRPSTPDLILSAGSVDFTLNAGSASLPAPQMVNVQSTRSSVMISYSVSTVPASANWFTVSPAGGSTPGTLNVTLNANAAMLAAASMPYQGTVSVMCLAPAPCAGTSQTFAVNVNVVNAPPQLSVFSDVIAFTAAPGASQALTQTVGLQNSGGGSIGFASITCATSLCTVSGVPSSISAGQTANITVQVDPASLQAGFYRTTLNIRASTGTSSVPVTLFIAGSPSVALQPSGTLFQILAGGVPGELQNSFLVNASGSTPISWTASVQPGASWLTVPVSSGSASATQPGVVTFQLDPGVIAALSPKAYYGTIRVVVAGVANSPQDFQVVLNVGPANASQKPSPSPAGLLFITSATKAPAPQTVTIATVSAFSVDAQASASTTDGAAWLSVTPATGQAQPGRPLRTQVSVDPTKLSPGIYTGGVSYAYSSLAVRTVNVTLIVTPAPKANARPGFGPEADNGSCSATQMAAVQTGLVNSFAQPTAWPTPLQLMLYNNCGSPVPSGQIVATFSNGDPPLPLTISDPSIGLYSATWTPRRASQQTTITMRASAPGLAPVTVQLGGAVTANAAPQLDRNSTKHIYNPLAAGALAPGTLVQISGTALAAKSATAAPNAPLPTTLNGTQVIIGGVPSPLISVSPGVLNAAIPSSLTPGLQYQVIVTANGALTTPDTIQLTATAPGLATTAAGLLLASHVDGTAVTEDAPAYPGEILILRGAGLGLTDTPVPDGVASPSFPLATALATPSIYIDGTAAKVAFAGLQPGMVGIYQINFVVPDDAKDGDTVLLLLQDDQPANTAVLPVKKKP